MSTTAQWVFNAAMYTLDEQSDTGLADTPDTADYKYRAIAIMNTLMPTLYPYSDTYTALTAGSRPAPAEITAMTDTIPLDDSIARAVLPLGLAFMLILDEKPATANNLKSLYDEAVFNLRNRIPAQSEPITDVYGILDHVEE